MTFIVDGAGPSVPSSCAHKSLGKWSCHLPARHWRTTPCGRQRMLCVLVVLYLLERMLCGSVIVLGRPKTLRFVEADILFVTLQSHLSRPGHRQVMEIQRPPEVTQKKNLPSKEKRDGHSLPNILTASDSSNR